MHKRPRHYAADIVAIRSPDQREAALEQVPSDFKGWVRELVQDHFMKRHFLQRYLAKKHEKNRFTNRW